MDPELVQAWQTIVKLVRTVPMDADNHDVRQKCLEVVARRLFDQPEESRNGEAHVQSPQEASGRYVRGPGQVLPDT